jgi:4-amino-4-deoxy-L-arabinose transferase-like glycosyltransferase
MRLSTDIVLEEKVAAPGAAAEPDTNRRWLVWAIPLAVLLAALIPRVLGLDRFLTADEDDQLGFAANFFIAMLAGDWKRAVLLGYPGVPTMALGGLGLALRYWLHAWGVAPLPEVGPTMAATLRQAAGHPLAYIQAARLPMAVMASLAVLGMYLLMRRLVGERIALLAALFIAFDPFFMAHSRILHVDAPLAYFMFLSFLAFLLYLREGRWRWLALSGVVGALAALSKTAGAVLVPILVVTGFIYALQPGDNSMQPAAQPRRIPPGWRRFGVALLAWGVVAAIAFYALWPSMWANPGRAMYWIIRNVANVAWQAHPTSGVFWGPTGSDQSPFYYLISLPFHLAPLVLIGLLAGVVVTWRLRPYRLVLLALWAYTILFSVAVSLIARRGDRYLLPVYLALDLLAAVVLYHFGEWINRQVGKIFKTPTAIRRARTILAGIALLAILLPALATYPYYFTYLNPLVGGGYTAPQLINIGWGEGLDQAADYLNQLPNISDKTVAAWYSAQFAPFFKGRTVDLSSNQPALTADYTVFYINQLQRGFPSQELLFYFKDRQPIYTVRLGGVDYAWIYPGPVVGTTEPPDVGHPVEAVLGGAVSLIGYDLPAPTIAADDDLPITLYWDVLAPIREDYNVYVRLVDDMGNVWGQADRLPLGGVWRTGHWQPGTYVRDEYRLSLRPGTPPATYHLDIGMYSFATGKTFGVARDVGQVTVTVARRMARPDELSIQHTLRVSVAPGLDLLGYDLGTGKVGPGERVPVTLYWQATRSLDTDYRVNLDARSVAGNEGGGWLDPLASEQYPTSRWRVGELLVDMQQLQMPATARSGFYLLSLRLINAKTGDYASDRVILGKLEFVERARNFETPQVQYPVGVDLGGIVQLIGYDLPQQSAAAGEAFPLTLYWRSLDETETSYTVFVHVVGPDGVIRGQWDSVPGGGTLPTAGWLKGEVITDEYRVPMAKDAPPWQYTIRVGVYDPRTGQRLQTSEVGGKDFVVLGSVRVK